MPISKLYTVLNPQQVLTTASDCRPYLQGIMHSKASPDVLAVVKPATLLQLWQVLQIAAAADWIIIAQAANTSLTGGSTPYGAYSRPVLVISMQQLAGVYLLNDGQELIALPAATLQGLEKTLQPLQREPHSVLGSSCVGASVIGGVCNNSGGALLQRGPAYTEYALYAQLQADGRFKLINHLGIDLGDSPESVLTRLQQGQFTKNPPLMSAQNVPAYAEKVRDINANSPARYNGDASRLFEASGSSGHLIVFAVRLPTYAKPQTEQVFFYSTADAQTLATLRRDYLASEKPLPVLAEYFDGHYAAITTRYGRDACWLMNHFSSTVLGKLYHLRSRLENHLSSVWIDRILQGISYFLPKPLTGQCAKQASRYPHHLIIKSADDDIAPMQSFLQRFVKTHGGALHICSEKQGKALQTVRFAGTAAMLRYYNLQQKRFAGLISTDIALPRNRETFTEALPDTLQASLQTFFSLGHFFCYVFHQDYFLKPDADEAAFKEALLQWYSTQGIAYPAEHNVGHVYPASHAQAAFFKQLDPTNRLNPGVGLTTKNKHWQV